ncbi:XRE family transcriptional regulator [Xanthomonas campestris pv. raphani]|uniref:XRE family transcriptional regulator n=1 Tax=Xanthomonas campestris TaxID=339 RepID=UPI002B23D1A7|nr:XRE family transcriptional regulator [Xanthomonas campestris]MEA9653056.1 XRE family transcriptional regulator [Xanthomonas campestris pv. raphani]MEB1146717.1 XRE family transcriptional regulator [Xanthomonas campestris pv. campestris]MEB1937029.1 XRE family transcriptional regulator [Xanthomonas campestris pv. campestris]
MLTISVTNMESNRRAKPTTEDVKAAERLKLVWSKQARGRGITQDKIADELGITQGAVSQYLNGKIPMNYRTLFAFCRALGIPPTDVRTDLPEQSIPAASSDDDPDYANVTGWSQAVGLGAGAEATEYAETHSLKFKKTSLRRRGILGRDLAVYYGRGDSMEPTIQDGDAILFDTSDTRPVDGSLYVIQVDGMANPEYYVKRALVLEAGVYFQSDNPAGDHQWRKPKPMVSKKHPITIIGRVHWVGGWRD